MVLYVVGLGLGDQDDITVRGLKAVQKSELVFLEAYTSILGTPKEILEEAYGKKIVVADRNMVESEADAIYMPAKEKDVAFLVVGDPLCATTHTDIMLRAKEADIQVEVIHNASVMGAVGSCGLQLYSFGYSVSIPLFEGSWRPDSFYGKIKYNKEGGMHTLCLLDIKMKEPDYEEMMKGKVRYLPPRFMSVNVAIDQLLEVEDRLQEGVLSPSTMAVGLARLGQPTQQIVAGTLNQLAEVDFGAPLHCLVICGELHPCEIELLHHFQLPIEEGLGGAEGEGGSATAAAARSLKVGGEGGSTDAAAVNLEADAIEGGYGQIQGGGNSRSSSSSSVPSTTKVAATCRRSQEEEREVGESH